MRAMRISNPAMRAIADAMERDEVLRWSNSLVRARVTRWGGMISTPDETLQVCLSLLHLFNTEKYTSVSGITQQLLLLYILGLHKNVLYLFNFNTSTKQCTIRLNQWNTLQKF